MFYDMAHSNNAARIRLVLGLKPALREAVDTTTLAYEDLQATDYPLINPLKKVPALRRADGGPVFESDVIARFLLDKYGHLDAEGPPLVPTTPEGRQRMNLLIRVHDLYIASPNTTAPGFSHTQGAMYLSNEWHGPARGMSHETRAAKLAEIWRQLHWLEDQASTAEAEAAGGPHLLGAELTLADLTWFPTCVFMEFMLPRVFQWPALFDAAAGGDTPFPALAAWYTRLRAAPVFADTHADIWEYWERMEAAGQFAPIAAAMRDPANAALKFTYGAAPPCVDLNYQEPPPPGKATGRYIDQPHRDDLVDEVSPRSVAMHDARELVPPASLEAVGFALCPAPTEVRDFLDDDEVVDAYYEEVMALVKAASGAERVFVFDHTVRETGNTNLNAAAGGTAAPVGRVHCDYTKDGAPLRLQQLGAAGIRSRLRGRELSAAEVEELAAGRFAFVNVWRSIDPDHPVMQSPLAVCDEASVPDADRFLYELRFPDRTGENYSLQHNNAHRWYYYPRMMQDEALVFKVYDKKADGPRFVFHTAFEDPLTPAEGAPPRRSIEVRTIAFFNPPSLA